MHYVCLTEIIAKLVILQMEPHEISIEEIPGFLPTKKVVSKKKDEKSASVT